MPKLSQKDESKLPKEIQIIHQDLLESLNSTKEKQTDLEKKIRRAISEAKEKKIRQDLNSFK